MRAGRAGRSRSSGPGSSSPPPSRSRSARRSRCSRSGRSRRGVRGASPALAALTAAASPVAFLLLTLVVVGLAIGRAADRWLQLAAGRGLLVDRAVLEALLWRVFPGGGPVPVLGRRARRRVRLLRALGRSSPGASSGCARSATSSRSTASPAWRSSSSHSAVGENIARLRYAAIPLAVLVLSLRDWRPPAAGARRPRARDLVERHAAGGRATCAGGATPAAHAAYWQPAISYLHAHLTPSYRVEAVDTAGHWAALYLPRAGHPARARLVPPGRLPAERGALRRPRAEGVPRLAARARRPVRRADEAPRPTTAPAARRSSSAAARTPLRPVFRRPHLTVYEVPHATPILTGAGRARVVSMTRVADRRRRSPGPARTGSPCAASRYWQPSAGCVDARKRRDDPLGRCRAPDVAKLRFAPGPGKRARRPDGRARRGPARS